MAIASNLLGLAMVTSHGTSIPPRAQMLPIRYEAGHFYAVPETVDGQRLKLLVDTGGGGGSGLYVLGQNTVKRLQLKELSCALSGNAVTVARLPDYKAGRSLPPPLPNPCGKVAFIVPAAPPQYGGYDGILGAGYLPGHVWTFDYPARQLSLEGTSWQHDPAAHPTTLGFPHNAKGQQTSGFARITLHVDGQPLDMLLDTGATAHPSPAGEKASGTPTVNGIGVASYITTSVLDRWHKAHPDWRVVDKGDDQFGASRATRLIEVPKVEIADWAVGPVWFTERPDHNFRDVMSSYMDKTVEGAVGGNVFGRFVMTIDYPHSTAWFRCVQGCTTVVTPPPAP